MTAPDGTPLSLSHEEAEQVCADNLGHLAFFKDEAEFNDYTNEAASSSEWLGMNYRMNLCFFLHQNLLNNLLIRHHTRW